jgi:hypothetical protein
MESLKLVARRLDYMHPFKIYNVPSVLRVTPDDDNDWRLFRVRAGQVMGVDVTGTDADDANPDDESYPDVDDFEVPISTPEYWFWIEDTGSGWVLRYGPDETASSYDGGPDPGQAWTSSNAWTTGPIPDSTHIPVGTVDTDTFSDDNTAVIRQLLRADVVSTAGTSDCPYG